VTTSVVIDGARTPIGKLLGAFASLSAVDLGAVAIRAALERSGVSPDQVDAVVFGQVLQAGLAQPGTPGCRGTGLPMSVPLTSTSSACPAWCPSPWPTDDPSGHARWSSPAAWSR
jgi:acetyl-CoA C-acetyltransferase